MLAVVWLALRFIAASRRPHRDGNLTGNRARTAATALAGWMALAASSLLCRPTLAQVSGTVVDAASQEPIAGARVSVQASDVEVLANEQGAFELAEATGDVVVVAAKKGYYYGSAAVKAPATGVSLGLAAVPLEDDAGYTFADPQLCSLCHPKQMAAWRRPR